MELTLAALLAPLTEEELDASAAAISAELLSETEGCDCPSCQLARVASNASYDAKMAQTWEFPGVFEIFY